ncbi:hypothetical protein, partial [Roseibium algae]
ADYIEALFGIWEKAFGTCNLEKLGEQSFNSDVATPSYLWKAKILEKSYYRDGSPDEGGRSDCLFVSISDVHVCLSVLRFKDETKFAEPGAEQGVEGWRVETEERGDYVSNTPVKLADFITDADATIQRFRDDAKRMIEALATD